MPAVIDVTVPPGVMTEQELMQQLDERLKFPAYFGGNWDAVEECLRDLSWLPGGAVVLRHEDIPLEGTRSGTVYLEILAGALAKHGDCGTHRLIVVFPAWLRPRVEAVLNRTGNVGGGVV
jgi:hypothetical protein